MSEEKQSVSSLRACSRCRKVRNIHALELCESCYTIYGKLRRNTYHNVPTFTVPEFIRRHMPRADRYSSGIKTVNGLTHVAPGFVVCGPVTEGLAEDVRRIALHDIPVIIDGETGVGKEGVARAIHAFSKHKKGPFVPVNCATITDGIAESELFGHTKGSFTGAVSQTGGFYGEAHGGTIFFDEIEALPRTMHGKFLRVLDSGEIRPVGSSKPYRVKVRTVVATNKNIEQLCDEGLFRLDLYHRLNGVTIRVPPLRERKEELPVLIQYFLSRCSIPGLTLDDSVRDVFFQYTWPGNIRQLKMVIERASIFAREGTITLEHIPEEIRGIQYGSSLRAVR